MRSMILAGAVLALAIFPAGCAGTATSAKAVDPAAEAKNARILAEAEPGQEIKTEDPNDPIICHNEADATSRIRKYKSCKTKSEWDRIERESRESVNNSIKNSGYNKESGN